MAIFSIKKEQRPTIGKRKWLIIKHGFFTFGVVTALSVLWQYNAGTIMVSSVMGIVIVGIIAGVVALVVNYLTIVAHSSEDK